MYSDNGNFYCGLFLGFKSASRLYAKIGDRNLLLFRTIYSVLYRSGVVSRNLRKTSVKEKKSHSLDDFMSTQIQKSYLVV